jgi:hypothetical protein
MLLIFVWSSCIHRSVENIFEIYTSTVVTADFSDETLDRGVSQDALMFILCIIDVGEQSAPGNHDAIRRRSSLADFLFARFSACLA